MLKRTTTILAAAAALALTAGCAVIRPMRPTLRAEYRRCAAPTSCLLVMLPGIGDGARSFERRGFVDDARMERLLTLFRMEFKDPSLMAPDIAGRPVYLGLAMNEKKRLRLKPQNLLVNLPLAPES